MSYNTDYLTKRLSDESRKPFLRLGVAIRRFFCSKILGHKIDLGYTDNGYMVCERCQKHRTAPIGLLKSIKEVGQMNCRSKKNRSK